MKTDLSGAHLGGAIAGLGVGMILLCNFCPTKKERWLRNIIFGKQSVKNPV